jgi:very-short-patch-repair endonuclease
MARIYNIASLKTRRRELRNNQTPAEKHLWQFLRRKQIKKIQFYRQYGIGGYIADLYAPSIKLCIEVDGNQHYTIEGQKYDKERDDFMHSIGITVLRFSNHDVSLNTDTVIKTIAHKVEELIE